MAENQEIKKELVFDLHFVHGPRQFVGLTERGLQFIRTFPLDDGIFDPIPMSLKQFYQLATARGLHISFEDDELRNRIAA